MDNTRLELVLKPCKGFVLPLHQSPTMPTKNCLHCNDTFVAPQKELNRGFGKFCSRKCSGAYKHSLPNTAPVTELTCAYCHNTFARLTRNLRSSRSGLHFCNRKCKELGQSLEGGNIKAIQPSHFGLAQGLHSYRDKALKELPNKCNRCGYDKYVGILKVHHKDRNRTHNTISNLELLCPNCHDLEHYLNNDGPYSRCKRGVIPFN